MFKTLLFFLAGFFVLGAVALVVEALFFTPKEKPLPPAPASDADLVRLVALALRHGLEVNDGWKDYGGHGLVFAEGVYVYGASHDGVIRRPSEVAHDPLPDDDRLEFADERAFQAWLLGKLQEQGPGLALNTSRFRGRLELAARYGQDLARLRAQGTVRV